jgi:hypothetical protein
VFAGALDATYKAVLLLITTVGNGSSGFAFEGLVG